MTTDLPMSPDLTRAMSTMPAANAARLAAFAATRPEGERTVRGMIAAGWRDWRGASVDGGPLPAHHIAGADRAGYDPPIPGWIAAAAGRLTRETTR